MPYPVKAWSWGRPRTHARLVNEPQSTPPTKEDITTPHAAAKGEPQVNLRGWNLAATVVPIAQTK